MDVQKTTADDLATVLGWLERKYVGDDGKGFSCNRSTIERALEEGDLWIIRQDGEAVALQVGDCAAHKRRITQGYIREALRLAVERVSSQIDPLLDRKPMPVARLKGVAA